MIRLVLLVLLVGTVLALKFLPWWGTLALFAGLVVVGKLLGGRLFRSIVAMPFKAKGRVLEGATLTVHDVTPEPLDPVSRDDDEDEASPAETLPMLGWCIEATVTPRPPAGAFQHWEPGELRLVRYGVPREDIHSDDRLPEADQGEIRRIELFLDRAWTDDEGMKLVGPQRVRLHAAIPDAISRVKLRYYFEDFGLVDLPRRAPAGAPQPRLAMAR